ncbi:amino acid ABC transporter ATP-binding protein [Selenomonadales bacterium OttesenSCG-928-I06]|nr:amino acid ABC transporter ATP-binding protein [Selenomonadales bacterium OttesenSCG-928-I06]
MLLIKNLSKSYGHIKALDKLDLSVSKGETVVVMGPSGCGKSTMVRSINRLVEPDEGSIIFDGKEIMTLTEEELFSIRKKIGFVFQQFNLITRLTAKENVMLGLVMSGMDREIAEKKSRDALDKVGLRQFENSKPDEMSGGQQQRVGIARALAYEPELMLWDEPTASLDPILVREVLVVMEELSRYKAATMLVVTHEVAFALHVGDRIALMDQGKVVELGSPLQVFTKPTSSVGKQYKDLIEYQTNKKFMTLSKE